MIKSLLLPLFRQRRITVCLATAGLLAGCQGSHSRFRPERGACVPEGCVVCERPAADTAWQSPTEPYADGRSRVNYDSYTAGTQDAASPSTDAGTDAGIPMVPPPNVEADAPEMPDPPADAVGETAVQPAPADTGGSEEARPMMPLVAAVEAAGGRVRLSEGGQVTHIDLTSASVTDEVLSGLSGLTELTEFNATDSDITDAQLKSVAAVAQLKSLKLKGCGISDDGLSHFSGHAALSVVDLGRTGVTGAGLSHLSDVGTLQYLMLNETGVGDDVVEPLGQLSSLRGINLIGTSVTADGVAALKKALPECTVAAAPAEPTTSDLRPLRDGDALRLRPASLSAPLGQGGGDAYHRALRLASQDHGLAADLGEHFCGRNEWKKAVPLLRLAVQHQPEQRELQFRLAQALTHTGRPEEARGILRPILGESSADYAMSQLVYDAALHRSAEFLGAAADREPANESLLRKLDELRGQLRSQPPLEQTIEEAEQVETLPQIIPRKLRTLPPQD